MRLGWFGPDKGSGVFVADGEEKVQVIDLRCEGIQGKLGNKMWGHRRPKSRCRIGKIMFRPYNHPRIASISHLTRPPTPSSLECKSYEIIRWWGWSEGDLVMI